MFKPPFTPEHSLLRDEQSAHVPGFPRVPRHGKDQVRELLISEFCSDDLDRVSDKLWWMSKQDSTSIWPLHRQLLQGRSIIVTENPKLHLVWINDRVFIKPLPRFIGSHDFWREHLCSNNTSEDVRIRRAALGYLRTYFYLIQHESDFRIAKDPALGLIPEDITWGQFCDFTSGLDKILDKDVSLRYAYGQIRLTRLNFYAPVILHKSYFQRVDFQYGQYFARFYAPVLFAFGITSVTLSGLQVVASLETGSANWQGLALGVSVLAILVSFGLLVGFGVLLSWKIAKEWKFAIKERRRLIKTERVAAAASVMAAPSHKNFRLRGIPLECETRSEVCSLIQKTLALEPSASPTVYSLACSPTDPNSKVATLTFPSIPECLSDRSRVEWNFDLSDDNDIDFSRSLAFDTHFTGFTPFHRASDKDCYIDLVAVCGLGGHALGSFKEKNGRFVWLRDALPTDIPNARILTYGYDTKLSMSNAFQNLTDLGRALQIDLEDIRVFDQALPPSLPKLILGGLVIKEAVRLFEEEPLESDFPTLNAVSGFAFFGVPHRGLEVRCLVPLVKDNPNRALLESLNKNSSLLDHLQSDFGKISKTRGISVVSFYETEKSPTAVWIDGKWDMSGPSEVLVEVFSATCGCQKQHPINRNHSEMVKYSGVHDQLYRRVVTALRPILGISRGRPGIGGIREGPQVCVQLSSDEQECLKSLSFPEQENRYSEISYASDTCDWLLEDGNYQKWMNAARGLFWIKGCPGTGKSVLMKFAVDTMSRRKSGEIIVSFFIHGRGIPLQQTPLGIFRALLNSLLMSFPEYLAELTEVFQDKQKRYGSYEQKNGWKWGEKELEKFLSRLLIEGTKEMPVVIFIDALDECGDHAKSLLVSLKSLAENAEQEGSLVRICFSSRHFPILGHETMARVYVEEKNDQDIRLVIEGRLKEIQPIERRRQIEKEILLKAHGGFQWAILITNMVLKEDLAGARTEDLLKIISTTPPDLDDLYDIILRGATKEKHKQMTKLFQWVVYAKRPLSAQELREALATDKDMSYTTVSQLRSHGNWSDSVSQFEMRVRYISRGLVEFQNRDVYEKYELGGEEWSREAQFIHQSAADFVAQKFLADIEEGPLSRSLNGAGHYEISRSFLRYLTLDDILNANGLSREKLSATFPLMPYGVTFLFDHVRGVEGEAICQDDLVALIQWNQKERLAMLANIWRIMDPEATHAPRGWPFPGASVLHIAIAFDSASLLDTLLQQDSSHLDAKDLEDNTPLQLALREDRQDLALMILERSRTWQAESDAVASEDWPSGIAVPCRYLGHVNTTNVDGETPLSLAISVKADTIIRGLIDAGADVKHEKSLLFYAISQEDKALVYKLIKEGSNLDGAVFFTTQCLNWTSGEHHILQEILKTLLEGGGNTRRDRGDTIVNLDGFDEDEEDEDDEEAIIVATRGGNAAVVSLLLSHGSLENVRDPNRASLILLAVERFHHDAAIVLFRDSPHTIFSEDSDGWTAFEQVIRTDQVELALSFVEEDRGVLTLHKLLYEAVKMNQVQFVDDLLYRDEGSIGLASKKLEDKDTPFMVAVYQEAHDMAELLLSTGQIDISVRNENGYTPFFVAILHEYLSIVELLLDTGQIAVSLEHVGERAIFAESIVDEFQHMRYANLGSAYKSMRCSNFLIDFLWWAIKGERLRMIKLLLDETMVNTNQTFEGQTPLLWAMQRGKEDVVKVILSCNRVDLHFSKEVGQTPFSWALGNGKDRMVLLLLGAKGFSIHRESNDTSRNLFWWAIGRGNSGVINMLHESGKYDINTKDPLGQTPLIFAAETCAEEAMRALLETENADIQAVDNRGDTAFSVAIRRGYRTIVDLLSTYMHRNSGITIRDGEH
ncbi:ankyrin protein 3 [Fusarium mundagurra]|uniref:Ankyrin protein 3 n=1 Tax=Fusarium mundagurra TaxID=1567541 RepID=A0A8H5YRU2_9HYPO|nr:ankyrin protein 3 [Fusarium mundagurra]